MISLILLIINNNNYFTDSARCIATFDHACISISKAPAWFSHIRIPVSLKNGISISENIQVKVLDPIWVLTFSKSNIKVTTSYRLRRVHI